MKVSSLYFSRQKTYAHKSLPLFTDPYFFVLGEPIVKKLILNAAVSFLNLESLHDQSSYSEPVLFS